METTSTTRYHREYTSPTIFDGAWYRTSKSAGDGYATADEAKAEPLQDRYYADTRIVAETHTVTVTVVE